MKSIIIDEFLIKKYLAEAISPEERYQQFYSDIDKKIYDKIVALDPTSKGAYTKKLLELYRKGEITDANYTLFQVYLPMFHEYNKSKKYSFDKIENIKQLSQIVFDLKKVYDETNTKKLEKEYKVVYEDDAWVIIIPFTYEASRYWGFKKFKTSWCTASGENGTYSGRKMFNSYCLPDENGKPTKYLYINYDKKRNLAYQFSFNPNEFRDGEDNEVNISDIGMSEGAMKYYIDNDLIKNFLTPNMVQEICDEINAEEISIDDYFQDEISLTSRISAFFSKKFECYVFLAKGAFMNRTMYAPIKIVNYNSCVSLNKINENSFFITFDKDEYIGVFIRIFRENITLIANNTYQPEAIDDVTSLFLLENEDGQKYIYDIITDEFLCNSEKDDEIADYDIYGNVLVSEYGEGDYSIFNIKTHKYYSNDVTAYMISKEFDNMLEYETYYNDGDKFINLDDDRMMIYSYSDLSDEDEDERYYYESYKYKMGKILKEYREESECEYPKLMEIYYKASLIYDNDGDLDDIELFIYRFETPDDFMFDFNQKANESDLEYFFGSQNSEKIMNNIENGKKVNEYINDDGNKVKEFECFLKLLDWNDFKSNDINTISDVSKKIFGTTQNFKVALFLLPDGEMLNGSQNGISRSIDHHQLESYTKIPLSELVDMGFIRLQPQSPGFELHKLPTFHQEQTLKQFVRVMGSQNFYVDYGNGVSATYFNPNPNVVIADIYRYFNDGIKPLK